MIAEAARLQRGDDREQPPHVVFGQAAGGLVEDEDARVGLRERAGDLDQLLQRDRQVAGAGVERDLGALAAAASAAAAARRISASRSTPRRAARTPSRMFSATVRCGASDSSW